VEEYLQLVEGGSQERAENMASRLHPGDVVDIPAGPRAGRYAVLRRLARGKKGFKLLVVSTSGRTATLAPPEVVAGSERAGSIPLPGPYRANDRKYLQIVTRQLRRIPDPGRRVSRPQQERRPRHPVADCPDAEQHVRWARKARRTAQRVEQLRARLRQEGVGLLDDFRSIEQLLEDWGYLQGWSLTERGRRLRFVYNELDLLLTEVVERGLFWSLTPPELAALTSCFVYEPRSDQPLTPVWPTAVLAERYDRIVEVWEELAADERAHRLPVTRRPDPGFVEMAYAWASLEELEELPGRRLAPGDFVRFSRQLVDLLRQLRDAFPELGEEARDALQRVDRGVVAAQGAG
jgi:ATP-dependent RNA helicase HelY